MTTTSYAVADTAVRRPHLVVLRWMASFPGFPLGGLAAMLLVGPVDGHGSAVLGALVTGTVLGAAQAFGLRLDRRAAVPWIVATALGLAAGLAIGSAVVDHHTELGDLVVQGLVSGASVGLLQGALVVRRGHPMGYVWPAYLAGAWALGWTLTTLVGVQVEDQFTVFGAAGAVTVTALTSVLPLLLSRPARSH